MAYVGQIPASAVEKIRKDAYEAGLVVGRRNAASDLTDEQVLRAVDAYDAARCAKHGQTVDIAGMSDTNKLAIAPMIKAAIEAALA